MYLNKLPLLFIIVGGATALGQEPQYAQVQLPGPCPKITYIINVDIPHISGWWYRTHSNFKSKLCYNNEGQSLFASQYDDTTLNLDMCCRSAADPEVSYCGSSAGSGYAVSDLQNPGPFNYIFLNNNYTVHVLHTDYSNIDIVYGCKPASQPHLRDEVIFVLSRDYNLNAAFTAQARQILKGIGVEWSKLEPIKQGPTVPYPPFPKKC